MSHHVLLLPLQELVAEVVNFLGVGEIFFECEIFLMSLISALVKRQQNALPVRVATPND